MTSVYISRGFVPLRGRGLGTEALCFGDFLNAWYFHASDICLIWKETNSEFAWGNPVHARTLGGSLAFPHAHTHRYTLPHSHDHVHALKYKTKKTWTSPVYHKTETQWKWPRQAYMYCTGDPISIPCLQCFSSKITNSRFQQRKKKTCSQLSQFEITSKFTTECRTRDMSCLLSSRWRNSWHGSLKKKLARQFLSFYCIFGQTSSVPKFIIKSLRPLPKCYWNIRTKNSYRRIVEGKGFFFLKFFVVFPRR